MIHRKLLKILGVETIKRIDHKSTNVIVQKRSTKQTMSISESSKLWLSQSKRDYDLCQVSMEEVIVDSW